MVQLSCRCATTVYCHHDLQDEKNVATTVLVQSFSVFVYSVFCQWSVRAHEHIYNLQPARKYNCIVLFSSRELWCDVTTPPPTTHLRGIVYLGDLFSIYLLIINTHWLRCMEVRVRKQRGSAARSTPTVSIIYNFPSCSVMFKKRGGRMPLLLLLPPFLLLSCMWLVFS